MTRFKNAGWLLGVAAITIASIAAFNQARAQDRQAVPREGAQEPQRRPPDGDQRRAQPRC